MIIALVLAVAGLAFELTRHKETDLEKAARLIQQGKAAMAIPMLEKLSREEPDDANVFPWLAQGYLATERYAEGRTALDTALRLKLPPQKLAPVIQQFADYYQRRGDFDEAEKLYQSVTRVYTGHDFDPGKARMYLVWGESNILNNQLQEAVQHLQLAQSLASEETVKKTIPHKLSDCYRRLAAMAEANHDDQEAIKLLEKSLSVCDEPLTRVQLALIYARNGQTEKAIENYESVSSEDPNNLEVRHRLIELLMAKHDYNKAQIALSDLTDKEKSVDDYELLADVNLKIHNYAGAVRALEEASSLRPSVPLLEKLKATLLLWSDQLNSEKKYQEATSVKGHADRVDEQLATMKGTDVTSEDLNPDADQQGWDPNKPPIAIVFSRNWLAKDSLTPEGKIKIKNITGAPISDLTLTAVFFDNTTRKRNGSVALPVASPSSAPIEADGERWLYFSCPQTVKIDHLLAVKIMWQGTFLKEFPVSKR